MFQAAVRVAIDVAPSIAWYVVIFSALDRPSLHILDECIKRKWGSQMDHLCLSLLLVADSFGLFATSAVMLEGMIGLWHDILRQHSHSFPLCDMVWCSTIPNECAASVVPLGTILKRRSRK